MGFLWLSPELREVVRPAQVSLQWDSGNLVQRFGWRGTWDPASALGLEAALTELSAWDRAGELEGAKGVADRIAAALRAAGLSATAGEGLVPPRLRAFLVADVDLADLRASLDASRVRAWTGRTADGVTILRISTHVYNNATDSVPLIAAVQDAMRRN